MIFCALLSGGDYAPGMMSMGTKTAVGLSLCGFGTELIEGIAEHREDPAALEGFLARWRMAVFTELKTNSRGKLSKRAPSKAIELERDRSFPDLKIVDYYIKPAISSGLPPPAWMTEPDLPSLIAYASATFEWSNAQLEMTCRNVIYPGVAMRELRKSALALDSSLPASLPLPLASSLTLFDSIHDRKTASSTKNIPSYRVQLSQPAFESIISAHLPAVDPFPIPSDPEQQVAGRRKTQVKEAEGSSPWRHWMPVEMVEVDARGAKLAKRWRRDVEAKEVKKQEKEQAKKERERGRKVGLMSSFMGSSKAGVRAFGASPKKGAGGSKRKRVKRAADSDDTVTSTEEEEEELAPPRRPGSSGLKSKSAVRRQHSLTDDSESSSSRAPPPPKSPRKSRTHTSPAKNRVKSSSSATVITLSSDDDYDEPLPASFASTSAHKNGHYTLSPPPARRPPAALADSATANFAEQLPAVKSAIKASSKPRKMDRNSSQSSRSISSGSGGRAGIKSFSAEIDLVAEEEEEAGLPSLAELFEQRRSQSRSSGKSGAAVDGRRAVGRAKGSAAAKGGAPKLQAMEEIVISDSD